MKKVTLLLITLCILITTVYAYNLTTIVNGNKLTATVNSGENVTIEYEDVDGYTFDGWSATGVTLTNPTSKNTSFSMPSNDVTIEPNMSLSHVHEFSNATCTVPPTCSCGATNGSELGHEYTGERICNTNGNTDTVKCIRYGSEGCTATESQDCTHTYTITVTQANGGTISPASATVKAGGSQTFTITGTGAYAVSDVLVNGTSVGAKTSHTISNVTSNQTITAVFEVDKATIPVGAYVTYKPSSTSYTVATTDSGYSSAQTFNPSATTSWRVMYNNAGQLDIVSTDAVQTSASADFYLYGKTGYAKAVDTLNNIGQAYVNSTYATSGRHIGSTNESVGTIDEETITGGVTGSPYTDELYTTDVNQLVNNSLLHSSSRTWLASRHVESGYEDSFFDVRMIDNIATEYYFSVYYVDPYVSDVYSVSGAVRPVVSLKSDIQITEGLGTQASPYVVN